MVIGGLWKHMYAYFCLAPIPFVLCMSVCPKWAHTIILPFRKIVAKKDINIDCICRNAVITHSMVGSPFYVAIIIAAILSPLPAPPSLTHFLLWRNENSKTWEDFDCLHCIFQCIAIGCNANFTNTRISFAACKLIRACNQIVSATTTAIDCWHFVNGKNGNFCVGHRFQLHSTSCMAQKCTSCAFVWFGLLFSTAIEWSSVSFGMNQEWTIQKARNLLFDHSNDRQYPYECTYMCWRIHVTCNT